MTHGKPVQPRCVLDSGGLSALTGRTTRARTFLQWLADRDGAVRIPAAILVESTTGNGPRDAEVNRVLSILDNAGAVLEVADEQAARRAGHLRFSARGDDGIDALVAACAVGDGSPAVVLTSDPDDLERLLVGARNVAIRTV